MRIDWFTVIAQVLNFLILVWLLKKFLYQPVLNAIDSREKKIAAQLKDAAAKEADAANERNLFRQKNEEFDQQRAAAMSKVAEETKVERQKQLEQIRKDSIALRQKLQQALEEQQQNISEEIKNKIQEEVVAIAGKTLSDLGSASLEEQIINTFIKRINQMNPEEKQQFRSAFNSSDNILHVITAFTIADTQKDDLKKAITSITGDLISFQYHVDPSLIGGVEIHVKNYRLSWNIENYLNDLKKHIDSSFSNTIKEKNVAD